MATQQQEQEQTTPDETPNDDDDTKILLPTSKLELEPIEVESSLPPITKRVGLCDFLLAYFGLLILNRPKTVFGVVASFLVLLIISVNVTLSNPPELTVESIIETDYSNVMSTYDLTLGRIDHWCLNGGDQKCRCEDPLQPSSKLINRAWAKAHEMNKDKIVASDKNLDVLFLGENIVEAWAGRTLSFNSSISLEVRDLFDKRFTKNKRKYSGLALGIAGDTAPNVLWRIQNGELPEDLNPKVIWLVVGTNDLAMKQCSEEVVLLGILRLVEEIQSIKPNAKIVINSILPMTSDKEGRVPDIKGMEKKHLPDLWNNPRHLQKHDKMPSISIRPDRPLAATLRISMWPSVAALNSQLNRFGIHHKRVSFFDAYDVFVTEEEEDGIPRVKEGLMISKIVGVPTVQGHDAWLRAIVRKLDYIFGKKKGGGNKSGGN